ncbi:MAG TPA: thiolase family protein [bacterium]|nr:thiolase family protein [bacterium]
MRDVYVIGAHTIKFGKYLENSIKELTGWALEGVLKDAGLTKKDLQSAWFSNSGWGMRDWQHCIRGQVALRPAGLDAIPITNVENACAGGSTAFHGAWKDVGSGLFDVSLAIGAEKTYARNKYAVFAGFIGGMDAKMIAEEIKRLKDFAPDPNEIPREQLEAAHSRKKSKKPKSLRDRLQDYWDMFTVYIQLGETLGYDTVKKTSGANRGDHSPFMDVYGYAARQHMKKYGSTQRQLAAIAAKNHWHSTMNPNAQYRFDVSIEDALKDRLVSYPLTRSMCAPIGDGAAAAILASEDVVKKLGVSTRAVKVRASVLASGMAREWDAPDIAERASKIAYERAGLGPADVQVAEVHDATAFGELHQTEALGFFKEGEGGVHAEAGETKLGGRIPVNPSGGLISRGHPIGASGLAQIHELVTQLRGEAKERQVQAARIALAENGGGVLGNEEAAMCIHILEK